MIEQSLFVYLIEIHHHIQRIRVHHIYRVPYQILNKMATIFSQVNIAQDDETDDCEFTAKNKGKRKRHTTSASFVPTGHDFEKASDSTKLSMIFEEILNFESGSGKYT